jgi:hypothetical protein
MPFRLAISFSLRRALIFSQIITLILIAITLTLNIIAIAISAIIDGHYHD